MIKKIVIIVVSVLVILATGCSKKMKQDDDITRIYLSDKYYSKGNFIDINSSDLSKLDKENYILFTYNNYCTLSVPCEDIFQKFMKKYKIDFLSISFEEFKKTDFYETVNYAPTIIIIENGKIITYLDANDDEDLDKYQDANEFEKWLNNYIYFSKSN